MTEFEYFGWTFSLNSLNQEHTVTIMMVPATFTYDYININHWEQYGK